MGRSLRDSLSVLRANTFIGSLEGGKGTRIASADLPIHGESGFTDLISLLLHSESAEARYRIDGPHRDEESPPLDRRPRRLCGGTFFPCIKK